jgi:hypothetical protein
VRQSSALEEEERVCITVAGISAGFWEGWIFGGEIKGVGFLK